MKLFSNQTTVMLIAEGVLGIAGVYIACRIALGVAEGLSRVNEVLTALTGG